MVVGVAAAAPESGKVMVAEAVRIVAPTSLSGNNTASGNPTLVVSMPTGALASTCSGTATTSVS